MIAIALLFKDTILLSVVVFVMVVFGLGWDWSIHLVYTNALSSSLSDNLSSANESGCTLKVRKCFLSK